MKSREAAVPALRAAITSVFLLLAVVFGGGGTPNPATEVLLQMAFVALALAWIWAPARDRISRGRQFVAVWLVCAFVLILPLLELIPLPSGIWAGLDGNGNRSAALALVGREQSWQPLSQFPSRTLASLLAMIPPLFAFLTVASLDARGRSWAVGVMVMAALATALFGALQISLGAEAPNLYREHHGDVLTGFQANRNAAADVLLIGIAASAALFVPSLASASDSCAAPRAFFRDRKVAGGVLTGLIVLLFFATVLTRSRMGVLLIPVALMAAWRILQPALTDLGRFRHVPAALILAVLLSVAAIAANGSNRALGAVADRFAGTDGRSELWQDALFAIDEAWPVGVGFGGAQPALITAERLEVLDAFQPNRVHNDYLELALEGGLSALLALAGVVLVLAWSAMLTWRSRPRERHFTALGLAVLLIAALHSFVDYPVRSMALACLIGAGAGLLVATPRRFEKRGTALNENRQWMGA